MSVDLLLANPLFLSRHRAERELRTPYFPLGVLYLAAYARQRGLVVAVFDGTFAEDESAFVAALEEHAPRVVGITAVLPTGPAALALARLAQASGAVVVLGGPDPTRRPAAYLGDPAVDFVVHHEGEETLVELLGMLPRGAGPPAEWRQTRGLAFRDEAARVVVTPRRPYVADLDRLPFPARDLIDLEGYLEFWRHEHGYASVTVAVSRGCPYGCRWCKAAVHGPTLRLRSPASVAEEVKTLKDAYPIDRLRLVDDVDGLDRSWFDAWAAAAAARDAVVAFEALNELERRDLPMLEVRDPL